VWLFGLVTARSISEVARTSDALPSRLTLGAAYPPVKGRTTIWCWPSQSAAGGRRDDRPV